MRKTRKYVNLAQVEQNRRFNTAITVGGNTMSPVYGTNRMNVTIAELLPPDDGAGWLTSNSHPANSQMVITPTMEGSDDN
jgi:hypothetical protein